MNDARKHLSAMRSPVVDLPEDWRPAIDDLPGELKTIADTIEAHIPGEGVRLTLLLAQVFPGQHLYFRKADKFIRRWRNVIMRSLYDQGEVTGQELSSLTGLSMRQVWEIIGDADSQEELQRKQLSLF